MTTNSHILLCQKVHHLIHAYNMDGRDFIRHLVSQQIWFTHVIMNLPGSAVEFLDVFKHLYPLSMRGKITLPVIHCYTFVSCVKGDDDFEAKAKESVEAVLQCNQVEYLEVFNVRDVSPKKNMLCVSFRLPEAIAFEKQQQQVAKRKMEEDEDQGNQEKKHKKQ